MKIEIVGAGVVGSAFGRALIARGENVQWVDSNPERVQSLRNQGLQADLPGPIPVHSISSVCRHRRSGVSRSVRL